MGLLKKAGWFHRTYTVYFVVLCLQAETRTKAGKKLDWTFFLAAVGRFLFSVSQVTSVGELVCPPLSIHGCPAIDIETISMG